MTYSLAHVDTCLPCYLLDHHNRTGEQLLPAMVSKGTRWSDVKAAIVSELNNYEFPDGFDYDMARHAINRLFKGVDLRTTFDSSLEESDDSGEDCYAWFVLYYSIIDITARGRLYTVQCGYCGADNHSHEWVHADHNERRDAMIAGNLVCECDKPVGLANPLQASRAYAARINGCEWSYDANRHRLLRSLS